MSDNILITGAEGFMGNALVTFLESRNETDLTKITQNRIIESNGTSHDFNLHDHDKTFEIVKRNKPKIIYHLGGLSSVTSSWTDPVNFVNYNTALSKSIINAVERVDPSIQVVFFSSSAVYGEKLAPLFEEDHLAPDTPYGMSKFLSELEISRLRNFLIFRPFSIIGSKKKNDALDDWITQILEFQSSARNILNVGNIEVIRDFLSVQDAVQMVWDLSNSSSAPGIYNLASGIPVSLDAVIKLLLEIADYDCFVNQLDEPKIRKVDKKYVVADVSKILSNKVSTPSNTLRETLEEMYWDRKKEHAQRESMEKND